MKHLLLDAFNHALLIFANQAVQLLIVQRALANETRLRDLRPITREQNAALAAALEQAEQLLLHKNELIV